MRNGPLTARLSGGFLRFVLATTDPAAGPRGLSLFMLDKGDLDPKRFSNLPQRSPPHGLLAALDISGIKLEHCSSSGTKFAWWRR